MQPGVTVVLATVWLVVSVGVLGAATRHPTYLTFDQYSPLPPYNDGVYRRTVGQLDWEDRDPAEGQPLDLSIGPRRSISANKSPRLLFQEKRGGKDLTFHRAENDATFNDDTSSLGQDKQSQNFAGTKFTNERVGHGSTKAPESFSRGIPPVELEDPFVADDTFQDQGPGSVEIYKLDLFKDKALLSPTPTTKPSLKNKGKIPKKTSPVNWKPKTIESKTTSPKIHYRHSNFFDELRTEVPPNSESFGVGGVPELQVGCEGIEESSHKLKRSIDFPSKEQSTKSFLNPWPDVTPISLDLDYELSSEEGYEEMDELLKLRRLETTTKKPKQNRGDMEATLHSRDFFGDNAQSDKLPVRGDLGNSGATNESVLPIAMAMIRNEKTDGNGDVKRPNKGILHSVAIKHESSADSTPALQSLNVKKGRKLLWAENSNTNHQTEDQTRIKRAIWGFGEDEGVVSSDELQTENERRRQEYNRRREEEARRAANRTQSEIDQIRKEYEKMLEHRQKEEEERMRRLQQEELRRVTPTRWQEEEQRRQEQRMREQEENLRRRLQEQEAVRSRQRWHDEERKRQELEASRRKYDYRPTTSSEEEIRQQRLREEEARRREYERREEERRRKQQEEERRRLQEEEALRRERMRWHEEMQRRRHGEERRNETIYGVERNMSEEDRRRLEERQREWMMKRRQEEEEQRRRLGQSRNDPPSNLIDPHRVRTNDTALYTNEADRQMREQQEREHQQKLREYIQRNQPINIGRNDDRKRMEDERRRYYSEHRQDQNATGRREDEEKTRKRMEEERRKLEEERKLQEYVRRNQPVHIATTNTSHGRNWLENRRIIDEARRYDHPRYPAPGNERRNHGPSAGTYIDPRSYTDEARRRQEASRLEEERRMRERQRQEEELRKEALRREEEVRRMQSRRYEEERRRLQAARLQDERRRKELIEEETRRSQAGRTRPLQSTRLGYEDRRRIQEHRRHETSFIPGNLVLDESRRAMERERQRQEQGRRRLEAERRRQELIRMQEAREKEQQVKGMSEQWRRQENSRLDALPVSARIILRSKVPPSSNLSSFVLSRSNFPNEIGFSGMNPSRTGVKVPRFPVPPTSRPPAISPGACVWAVLQCCPTNNNRLVTCFESLGCPGINWDPNPCRKSIVDAAREEVMKFYAAAERDNYQ